jgi:hypothetical protein
MMREKSGWRSATSFALKIKFRACETAYTQNYHQRTRPHKFPMCNGDLFSNRYDPRSVPRSPPVPISKVDVNTNPTLHKGLIFMEAFFLQAKIEAHRLNL